MTKIKGNSVLITGGASGIGRIMGRMSLERGARIIPILKPEWVAKKTLKAIEKNKKISSWPLGYHLIRILQAILPLKGLDLLCKALGIYNALDHFKGRK